MVPTSVIPVAEATTLTIHQHVWLLGACRKCGIACQHTFVDGVCTNCQMECPHKSHDEKTRICSVCGITCEHDYNYHNRTCSKCGRELVLYSDCLPDEYYEPCENAGKVEYVKVDTYKGAQTISIYTPYNYDPNKKYDVMVVIGGLNSTCYAWFDQELPFSKGYSKGKYIFDNMIDKGNCRPLILMSINTYSLETMPRYMKDHFLPYLIENYSTYAQSVDDMKNQREHFGIGGISWGGYQTFYGGFRDLFDLFGNYCPVAGSIEPEFAAKAINEKFKDYNVNLFVCGCGTKDGEYRLTKSHYTYLIENTEIFKEGKNTYWLECNAPHSWKEGAIIMCDFLQMAFP